MATKFVVCRTCEGSGTSSAYLGSFTSSEFHEQFDDDEARDYFAGRYDRKCEECDGLRVSREPSCTPEEYDQDTACDECATIYCEWETSAMQRAEMRMGA